jgi:hypothetical protein
VKPSARAEHLQRLFPVVAGGKVMVLVVAEVFFVFVLVMLSLGGGGSPSSVLKACVIYPAMILIALCSSDTVAALRGSGELELAVTLANPARVLFNRLLPVLTIAAAQVAIVGMVLMVFLPPWQVIIGWAFSALPLALTVATTLYWNLRLRGPGAVLVATLVTMIPALVWIGDGEMFLESENMIAMTLTDVVLSFGRCQLGLLLATVCLVALAHRRLQRTEELLDE